MLNRTKLLLGVLLFFSSHNLFGVWSSYLIPYPLKKRPYLIGLVVGLGIWYYKKPESFKMTSDFMLDLIKRYPFESGFVSGVLTYDLLK